MKRPLGVAVIGSFCLMAGVYLCSISTMQLIAPKAIHAIKKAPIVSALRWVNPFFTLPVGVAWALVAWGLFRLRNWARVTGAVMLGISVAWIIPMLFFYKQPPWRIVAYCVEIALRLVAVFYLMAAIDTFQKKPHPSSLSTIST